MSESVNTLAVPYTNQAVNIARLQQLFWVLRHSRRQNVEKSCHAESRAISDYLVKEEIEIRSHSNSFNKETFVSLNLAWQTTTKLLKQRKDLPKQMQRQAQQLFTEYNILIGSPPFTLHDRMLLYAFRTASVLFHCNILTTETKICLRNVGCFENLTPLLSRADFITKYLFSTQLCRQVLKCL